MDGVAICLGNIQIVRRAGRAKYCCLRAFSTWSAYYLLSAPNGIHRGVTCASATLQAQQSVGLLDLSTASEGTAFSTAVRRAAEGGPFGAWGASQPLVSALGTLATRDANVEYKTYSQLADEAVDGEGREFWRLGGLEDS